MENNSFKKRAVPFVCCIAAALVVYFALNFGINSGVINRYYAKVINLCLVYVVAAVSLNLTCGFLGQLPLGHAGFMAIGAYTSALISKSFVLSDCLFISGEKLTFFIACIAGGLVAALVGVVIGLPALRLKGDYLAIITLGFGEIIRVVFQNIKITGGAMGFSGIPRYTDFSVAFFWSVIVILFSFLLVRSKHGRAILSIKEDEIASESCGVNTVYYKTFTFAAAAFFGGIAGALLAHHICYIEPGNFTFSESIEILVMVVLGGLGSVAGSVISAIVLTVLPELLVVFSEWRMIMYSLLLVVVMIFRPSGLMGNFKGFNLKKKSEKEKEEE